MQWTYSGESTEHLRFELTHPCKQLLAIFKVKCRSISPPLMRVGKIGKDKPPFSRFSHCKCMSGGNSRHYEFIFLE